MEGVLTFGTKVNNHKSVLIPDLYQMTNYNESIIYGKNDNLDFNNKINKIIFNIIFKYLIKIQEYFFVYCHNNLLIILVEYFFA